MRQLTIPVTAAEMATNNDIWHESEDATWLTVSAYVREAICGEFVFAITDEVYTRLIVQRPPIVDDEIYDSVDRALPDQFNT
jgi:hypothetical protein